MKTKTVMDIYAEAERAGKQYDAVRNYSGSSRKSLLNETSGATEHAKLKLNELTLFDERENAQLPHVPKIFYGNVWINCERTLSSGIAHAFNSVY